MSCYTVNGVSVSTTPPPYHSGMYKLTGRYKFSTPNISMIKGVLLVVSTYIHHIWLTVTDLGFVFTTAVFRSETMGGAKSLKMQMFALCGYFCFSSHFFRCQPILASKRVNRLFQQLPKQHVSSFTKQHDHCSVPVKGDFVALGKMQWVGLRSFYFCDKCT